MKRSGNRVGVRELRQNLSVYLRRVASGEVLEVTERGRPVAVLAPKLQSSPGIERLVATGRAIPPVGELIALGLPTGKASSRLSEALEEQRAERI
ncbi:MAG TPA: type II toxin-antitoxin system prevent-host-death family antitoxin [Thermoanaerobaculia bacterium]|nr:type II toxin-antitoxin system prevent-host-death family antitoxin [Thermoanaerobaculia bacterium]